MRPVAAMLAAVIADAYGLYPIFIATSVIYFIGLGILHFGVRIEEQPSPLQAEDNPLGEQADT